MAYGAFEYRAMATFGARPPASPLDFGEWSKSRGMFGAAKIAGKVWILCCIPRRDLIQAK
jgi:hypothetical protein